MVLEKKKKKKRCWIKSLPSRRSEYSKGNKHATANDSTNNKTLTNMCEVLQEYSIVIELSMKG